MRITGHTRVAGLLGYPARYSLSPVLHRAAYDELGLDAVYVVFPVQNDRVGDAVRAIHALDLMGVSVTLPHKEAVIPFLDHLSPQADNLGAVNTIVVGNDGALTGHNTDGAGFVASLGHDMSFTAAGKHCAVLGAGGAARAVISALAEAGASEVSVIARRPEQAAAAAQLAGAVGLAADADAIARADLVVNATPVGMEASPGLPCDVSLLHSGQLAIDLIYAPAETAWLQAARAAGAKTANGLGMLVHQAAEQVWLWTGQRPSADIMRAALIDH